MIASSKQSDKILPPRIHLLGYSGAMLSILFERLKVLKFSGEIFVVPNIGVTDEVPFENGLNYQIIPFDAISDIPEQSCLFCNARPIVKRVVFDDFKNKIGLNKGHYLSLLDPTSTVASNAIIHQGISIEPNVTVCPYVELGFGVTIARNCSVGHHSKIGEFTTLNPGVNVAGHCAIGEGTTIGIGTCVFDHVSIGNDCQIGGGSVVTRNIPDGVVAFGNPCRVIRSINT